MGMKIDLFRRNDEGRIANDQVELPPAQRLKKITFKKFNFGQRRSAVHLTSPCAMLADWSLQPRLDRYALLLEGPEGHRQYQDQALLGHGAGWSPAPVFATKQLSP